MAVTRRRVRALLAVLVLGAMAALGGASAAHAASADIDRDRLGSLTVQVLSEPTPSTGMVGDGSQLPEFPEGALPVDNVIIQIERVTAIDGEQVDLTTDAGWAHIEGYLQHPASFPSASSTLVSAGQATTGDAGRFPGQVVFEQLPVGLYWVTEIEGPDTSTRPLQPFLVTIPMPTQQPGVFNYDVHAYPKIDALAVMKTVDVSDAHVFGDVVHWTITSNVPWIPAAPFSFGLSDMLPTGLVYVATPAPSVTLRPPSAQPIEMLAGVDYSIDVSPGFVIMMLEDPGLAKLSAVGGHSQLDFTLSTRVVSTPSNGTLTNHAALHYDRTSIPPAYAKTYWGAVRVNKVIEGGDAADQADRLAGAGFQVFASEAAAAAAVAQVEAGVPVTGGLSFAAGSGVGADGKTFVTADQGADHGFVVIRGLKASPAGERYWLVETQAPAGYVASSKPIEITVRPGRNPSGAGAIVSVENRQREVGALPVLGGAGGAAVGVAGAVLIGGGVLFALFGRRRRGDGATTGA